MNNKALKVAICQINPCIGDLERNFEKTLTIIHSLQKQADLLVFPELSLTGYPPKDLVLCPDFVEKVSFYIDRLLPSIENEVVIIGAPCRKDGGKGLYNSAFILSHGKIQKIIHKSLLPFYDVFDEPRYFDQASSVDTKSDFWTFSVQGQRVACTICEDMWTVNPLISTFYPKPHPLEVLHSGPPLDLLVNISASPWYMGKWEERTKVVEATARMLQCPVIQANQVGANDDLIFDGRSLYVSSQGDKLDVVAPFQEEIKVVEVSRKNRRASSYSPLHAEEELFKALVFAARDYFQKQNFTKAVIGVSGGVDSCLVASILAEALGPQNVLGVMLPTRYTSQESLEDAHALCSVLGIEYRIIHIDTVFSEIATLVGLKKLDHGDSFSPSDQVTWENIQARVRAVVLMAIANRENRLVISSSNKSELSQGYSTLYGDAIGAMSLIGDLLKQDVYRLIKWFQKNKKMIPSRILTKDPSAELRENQKDSDTLLPYTILDPLVEALMLYSNNLEGSPEEKEVEKRLYASEYKRRQAPFSVKVSSVAFGSGRRFPIVHGYRESC